MCLFYISCDFTCNLHILKTFLIEEQEIIYVRQYKIYYYNIYILNKLYVISI